MLHVSESEGKHSRAKRSSAYKSRRNSIQEVDLQNLDREGKNHTNDTFVTKKQNSNFDQNETFKDIDNEIEVTKENVDNKINSAHFEELAELKESQKTRGDSPSDNCEDQTKLPREHEKVLNEVERSPVDGTSTEKLANDYINDDELPLLKR
ncbi:hypothetical protein CEXT_196421 [Caerostris extrusa]|uniref:Uncharacterized protein n=1 Tax=Caerostris extrusa TaxID=172846 RepID=A0AAV4MAR7_CAEEX|nr:hypothetical protein CEXT_196421 [Caerostris extrusa]